MRVAVVGATVRIGRLTVAALERNGSRANQGAREVGLPQTDAPSGSWN